MQRHPVMVYVHGESFEWNSGNPYDGSVLASYADLVVVTLNYRLGILGFLNANLAPHLKARVANYGLMDQIAALHWVQQNIALFGGDPSNVTLFGHGTGAACINFLMTSPTVMPGLFHRAVLLSGSALSSWALVEDPVSFAVRLARQTNCTVPADLFRDHERVVDCLREVPLEELLRADVSPPAYLSAFGPSVDGVVIRSDLPRELLSRFGPGDPTAPGGPYAGGGPASQQSAFAPGPGNGGAASGGNVKRSGDATLAAMGSSWSGAARYDVLFGVVTSEALWRFSAADVTAGFEGERRDKILRTYVRNAYTYHLSEILVTVVNEYTDWERTVQHPINTRDATVAALSDAQFVAPLVQAGDLISYRSVATPGQAGQNRAFFYVFDYQTKDGDYPQRMGTVHGEELPYIFGAPLVDGFNHFPRNYTKSEVGLSEAVIVYLSNFARTGNPNEHQKQEPVLAGSKERNRFRSIVWDEYDAVHQKYLEISMKPRMKNHFRAHQLSVWLRLIPELHRAGMEDVVARHNLFRNHNDVDLYDGPVRPDPLSRAYGSYDNIVAAADGRARNGSSLEVSVTTMDTLMTTCVTVVGGGGGGSYQQQQQATHPLQQGNTTGDTLASLEAAGYAAYSTALSVTIAIGCSLLILNVLIFAGVYYQRDKTRLEVKSLQQQQQQQQQQQGAQSPGAQLGRVPSAGSFDTLTGKHRAQGHYHVASASVVVDVEQDTAAMMLAQSASPSHHALAKQHLAAPQPNVLPNLLKAPPPSPNVAQQQQQQQQGGQPQPPMHQQQMQPQQQGGQHITQMGNNVAPLPTGEPVSSASPPNGSATMHLSVPRPPPPPRSKSPPEAQHHHQHHPHHPHHPHPHLRVPAAAIDEMRV